MFILSLLRMCIMSSTLPGQLPVASIYLSSSCGDVTSTSTCSMLHYNASQTTTQDSIFAKQHKIPLSQQATQDFYTHHRQHISILTTDNATFLYSPQTIGFLYSPQTQDSILARQQKSILATDNTRYIYLPQTT